MDHLVAISDYVKEIIVKKYDLQPNNISVINRGIDTEYFNQPLDVGMRDNILKTHQIDTAKKIILFPANSTNIFWVSIFFITSINSNCPFQLVILAGNKIIFLAVSI